MPQGEHGVRKEVDVLSRLHHVNIVEHIDYFSIDEKEKIYIVLEYIGGGTLQGLIGRATNGIMPRKQAQLVFRQLLSAVEHIHSKSIVHCDIKPDNLMFTIDGVLKMTDFGSAEEIGVESDYEILTKSGGSPAFQPPEVKSGTNASSPVKIDIWAMGITLYIIATGKYPFSGTNIYSICENISKGEYQLPDSLEPDLAKLIKGILQINPTERYTIHDIKNSSWVSTDIISDELFLPYHAASPPDQPAHDIFAQNYRLAAGQQALYGSASDDFDDEEPTMFTLDESEHSNYSSGGAVNHHNKLKHSNHTSNASPNSSMTNLPSATLTSSSVHSHHEREPKAKRKSRCSIM